MNGIRTVASGESLLAPAVTRTLIGRFADRLRPVNAPTTATDDVVTALTQRELEVFQQIAAGLSNAEIAATLVISPETVRPMAHGF